MHYIAILLLGSFPDMKDFKRKQENRKTNQIIKMKKGNREQNTFHIHMLLLFNIQHTSNTRVHPAFPTFLNMSLLRPLHHIHSLTPASHTEWPKSRSLPPPLDTLLSFFSFLFLSSSSLTTFSPSCLCYLFLYFCHSFYTFLLHLCTSLSFVSCYP